MHQIKFLVVTLFFVTTFTSAQNKIITLEEIWIGTFNTERMDALHSMNNGEQYSVLNRNSMVSMVETRDSICIKK